MDPCLSIKLDCSVFIHSIYKKHVNSVHLTLAYFLFMLNRSSCANGRAGYSQQENTIPKHWITFIGQTGKCVAVKCVCLHVYLAIVYTVSDTCNTWN